MSRYETDEHLIDRIFVYVELPEFRHVTFAVTSGTMQANIYILVILIQVYRATSKTVTYFFTNTDNVASTNAIKCGAETGMER